MAKKQSSSVDVLEMSNRKNPLCGYTVVEAHTRLSRGGTRGQLVLHKTLPDGRKASVTRHFVRDGVGRRIRCGITTETVTQPGGKKYTREVEIQAYV